MGGAMLDGWLDLGLAPQDIVIVDPQEGLRSSRPHIRVVTGREAVPELSTPTWWCWRSSLK